MVRRTKEEALATRASLLDAAERLFQAQGVSRTSLHEIAQAAGVTRGAVYWHFRDKIDLFNAMMERVVLPLECAGVMLADAADGEPLGKLRAHVLDVLQRVENDPQVQRVVQIATQKVEYAGELLALRDRHLAMRTTHLGVLERFLTAAQQQGSLPPGLHLRTAAVGLHALVDGLIQDWMLDPSAFELAACGAQVLDAHLAGLTRPTPARTAAEGAA